MLALETPGLMKRDAREPRGLDASHPLHPPAPMVKLLEMEIRPLRVFPRLRRPRFDGFTETLRELDEDSADPVIGSQPGDVGVAGLDSFGKSASMASIP